MSDDKESKGQGTQNVENEENQQTIEGLTESSITVVDASTKTSTFEEDSAEAVSVRSQSYFMALAEGLFENRKAVIVYLLGTYGPMAVADMRDHTGYERTSFSVALLELRKAGTVVLFERRVRERTGKPNIIWALAKNIVPKTA